MTGNGSIFQSVIQCARLEMCTACKLHGKIIFSDGSASAMLNSKSEAEAAVTAALADGTRLLAVEATELYRQIEASSFLDADDVETLGMVLSQLHQAFRDHGQGYVPAQLDQPQQQPKPLFVDPTRTNKAPQATLLN